MTLQELHPRDDIDRLYVSRKEEGRGLSSIENTLVASIQGLREYIKKSKERLTIETRNNTNRIMINRTTRKPKWE